MHRFVSLKKCFPSITVPVELCLSFSFFFFLHFQGLNRRPRVASLLLRRMGGVWTPVTRQPVLSTLCCSSTSTTVTVEMEKKPREGFRVVMKQGKSGRGWKQKRGEGVCCSIQVGIQRMKENPHICAEVGERRKKVGERETRAQLVSSPY